jgi:hypothetical protein
MAEKSSESRLYSQNREQMLIASKQEEMMYPNNVSSQEAYGKHRNSEDFRQMERQNQIRQARSYQYGEPVNSKVEFEEPHSKKGSTMEASQPRRLGVPLLSRLILYLFPFLRF